METLRYTYLDNNPLYISFQNTQLEQPSCNRTSSTVEKKPLRRGVKRKEAQVDLLQQDTSVLKKPGDSCDSFARYIASELREMNENQRILAKNHISHIICQARLDKLVDGQNGRICKPVYYNSGYYTKNTSDCQPSPSPQPYQPSLSSSPSNSNGSNISFTNM